MQGCSVNEKLHNNFAVAILASFPGPRAVSVASTKERGGPGMFPHVSIT